MRKSSTCSQQLKAPQCLNLLIIPKNTNGGWVQCQCTVILWHILTENFGTTSKVEVVLECHGAAGQASQTTMGDVGIFCSKALPMGTSQRFLI